MRTSSKSTLCLPALAAALALIAPTAASAHPGDGGVSEEGVIQPGSEETKQHGERVGHLPAKRENVRLVGKAPIKGAAEGRVADVAAFGNYAYLTVRDPAPAEEGGCNDAGVAIMDISRPSKPRQVGFINATEGSFPGEGAQVLDVSTRSFKGQVLLFNNEICDVKTGKGGASLWDVTNPKKPKVLTAHAGDTTVAGPKGVAANPAVNEIHSVLGWTDRKKAYAVLVDNVETADVDILDISNPRKPVLISESDLNKNGVLQKQATPLGGNSFLHDIEVQRIKGTMTMVASYWDGGWTLLDVDDPAKPAYIDDFDYAAKDPQTGLTPQEGNAHQAEFSPDGKLIIGTDEDFNPYRLTLTAGGVDYQAAQGSDTPQLDARTSLAGPTVFFGQGCTADTRPTATAKDQVAVIERGTCPFSEKAQNAQAAGFAGVILFNSVRADGCAAIVTPFVEAGIPVASVGRGTAYALFGAAYDDKACLAGGAAAATPFAVGAAGAPVAVAAVFDGWGYTRLMSTDGLEELGTYALEESLDPRYATGFGDLSVHEVAVDPRKKGIAYLSHYSGGLRVVKYGRNGIKEVGAYIAKGGNNFWGVEVHKLPGKGSKKNPRELVLASDRDSGLWIFEYTGKK